MAAYAIQHHSCNYHRTAVFWILIILDDVLLTYLTNTSCGGASVSGSILRTSKANSSPSHIVATKGSSVNLHWNYTYIGDGRHGRIVFLMSHYKEQTIGFSSASKPQPQVLAKRIGQNGALTVKSSIPVPFNGRVEVISSNSTLVIRDLQYNDSAYQYSSVVNVKVDMGAHHVIHDFLLKPIVSLTVNGIPEFKTEPPSEVEVDEDSTLTLRIEMEGHPKPKAYFVWTHRSSLSVVDGSSHLENPFRFHAVYRLNNIRVSFCGKELQITLRNNVGSSPVKHIRVFVLMNLEKPFNLTAKRLPNSRCFEAKWIKVESGACDVLYIVKLRDAYGKEVNKSIGKNFGEVIVCNALQNVQITEVQLTVKFRNMSKTVTATVAEKRMLRLQKKKTAIPYATYRSEASNMSTRQMFLDDSTTPTVIPQNNHTSNSLGPVQIVKIFIGILVLLMLTTTVIFFRMLCLRASDKCPKESRKTTEADVNYTDLLPRTNEDASAYAQLDNEYEEIDI